MALPLFQGAGAGFVITTGSDDVLYNPGSASLPAAGNLIALHILQDGTGTGPTIGTVSNIENIAGTDNALSTVAANESVGTGPAARHHLYIGRVMVTDTTCSVAVTTGGDDLYCRIYEFSDVNAGTALSDVFENGSAAVYVNAVGLATTVNDVGVTTLGADRLACNFIAVNDDNALLPFDTETGGNWVEAVAEFASATGTDGCIGLQIADMETEGTINGGTFEMLAVDSWGIIGLAWKPTSGAAPRNPPVSTRRGASVAVMDGASR